MTKTETIERITEHLHALDDKALDHLLHLIERIPPADDDWDRQIRADSDAGRLDHLIEGAREDYRRGRTRKL